MHKFKSIFFAACIVAGCAEKLTFEDTPVMPAAGGPSAMISKAINSSENAAVGSILLFLEEDAADRISASGDLSSAEVASIENVLAEVGALELRRVFPDVPGKVEKARKYGMHRWFEVSFPADMDVVEVASLFAPVAEVARIQFNTVMAKASDGVSYPYEPMRTSLSAVSSGRPFNDPGLVDQWHYINNGDLSVAPTAKAGADVNVKDAWRLTGGDPSIVVAVLDEGVWHDHPDLQANMWVNKSERSGISGVDDDGNGYKDDIYGYNFVTRGPITWDASADDSGHGTHVAGTVAAVNGNNTGVCGVAGGTGNNDGVKIMSCQLFVGKAGGTSSISAEAFKYAADNGASIAQCSWGYNSGAITSDAQYERYSSVEYTAIKYFMETRNNPAVDGGIVVFAAGNDSEDIAGYPGAYRDYLCVTSFAADNMPAYYTNYGPGSNVAAPGGEYYTGGVTNDKAAVLSTLPLSRSASGYGYMQGTSMACPHASGVAALGLSYMLKLGKTCSLNEFNAMFLTSVNDMEKFLDGTKTSLTTMNLFNYRNKMGTGTLDAWRFLMQIEGTPCAVAKVGEQQRIDLSEYIGGGAAGMTYLGVDISDSDMAALGFEVAPEIKYGKLVVKPTKPGCCKLTVRFIAGGDTLGSNSVMGGMEVAKEISLVARPFKASNGGWL